MTLVASLDENLKLTTDYDSDIQYMAILELTKLVERHYSEITAPYFQKIVNSFLQLANHQVYLVHTYSIRCLAKITPYISADLCRKACLHLVHKLAAAERQEDSVAVFSIGLCTMIAGVGFAFGSQLKELLNIVETELSKIAGNSRVNRIIKRSLIEVAIQFIKKWPALVDQSGINKTAFSEYLYNLVVGGQDEQPQKQAATCLGYLSKSLSQQQINKILQDLHNYLENTRSESEKKSALIAIDTIFDTRNRYLQDFAKTYFTHCEAAVQRLRFDEELGSDTHHSNQISELLSLYLRTLDNIILSFPKQAEHLVSQQFTATVKDLLIFSPVTDVRYIQQDVVYEDVEEGEFDSSYRVRESALKLVVALSKLQPQYCEEFTSDEYFFWCLREEKTEVRAAAFKMIAGLFEAITIRQSGQILNGSSSLPEFKRVLTNYSNQAPLILTRTLEKVQELMNAKQLDEDTRLECANLLHNMARHFSSVISQNSDLISRIITIAENHITNNSTKVEVAVVYIKTLDILFARGFTSLDYDQHLALFQPLINHKENDKINNAALSTAANMLLNYREVIPHDSSALFSLIQKVIAQSTHLNSQEAKEGLVSIIGVLLEHYLPKNYTQSLVHILRQRLEGDVSKRYVLSAIKTINLELVKREPGNKTLISDLVSIALYSSTNSLNNEDSSVSSEAAAAIGRIVHILGAELGSQAAETLIINSKKVLSNGQFPEYIEALIELFPKKFESQVSFLLGISNIPTGITLRLVKHKVLNPVQFKNILKNVSRSENISTAVRLLTEIQIPLSQLQKQLSENVWGQIVLRTLASRSDKYYALIKKYKLSSKDPETVYQASIALGVCAAHNFDKYIPETIQELGSNPSDRYNTLTTIREAFLHAQTGPQTTFVNAVNQLIAKCRKEIIQSELSLVAACVARFYEMELAHTQNFLDGLIKGSSEQRFIFSAMFRYINEFDLHHIACIKQMLSLINDSEVEIRSSAVRSFTHVILKSPNIAKALIDKDLMNALAPHCVFDSKLIRILDPIVKTEIDTGKPLRANCFRLLETALERSTYEKFHKLNLYQDVVSMCFNRFNEDLNEEVMILRLNVLRLVSIRSPASLVPVDKEFSRYLSLNTRLGEYLKPAKKESGAVSLKTILRHICEIHYNMRDEYSAEIESYYKSLKADTYIRDILVEAERDFA